MHVALFKPLNIIGPAYSVWNMNNAPNANQFNIDFENLLDRLKSTAALGDSHSKYATNTSMGPNNQIIYGSVQCTPDLSGSDCSRCLDESISDVATCCRNIRPSCIVRYEANFKFYGPTADAAPPPPVPFTSSNTNSSSEGKSDTSKIARVVAVPVVVIIVVLSFIFFIYLRVKKAKEKF